MKIQNLLIVILKKIVSKKNIAINIHSRLSFTTHFFCEKSGKISVDKGFHAKRCVTLHAVGGNISIGENVFMNENVTVVSHSQILINSNVTIGPNVVIYDHDHDFVSGNGFIAKPIIIEENVWIGAGAIILKGVKIGKNSVIAAGTIVTKDIPDRCVAHQDTKMILSKIDFGQE